MNKISLMELAACVCELVDLVSDQIKDHHNKTACGAYHLANAMGLDGAERRDIVIAAAMHDLGGLSVKERLSAIAMDFEDANDHAEKGYRLLSGFEPFERIANIIRNHHTPWNYGKATGPDGNPIPLGSQIVLMADRISVMLKPGINMLNNARIVAQKIIKQEGAVYDPALVGALKKVSFKDVFWLDIMSQSFSGHIYPNLKQDDLILYGSDLTEAFNMICEVMDFRSAFTAYHSKGVSVISGFLSELMDFPEDDVKDMKIAGLVHDIGKLAVPTEIIEKPGPLSSNERSVIRSHPYYTDRALVHLSGFDKIREWASLHHENADGSGYPFGLSGNELSTGSKIIKTADIFVALAEERPYRRKMGTNDIMKIMENMANNNLLDKDISNVLRENSEAAADLIAAIGSRETLRYKKFMEGFKSV